MSDQKLVRNWRELPALVVSLCVLLTLIVLLPNLNNGWVNWDDPDYVLNNALIRPLSVDNVKTIFTALQYQGNYHPLTLLSYAADYAIGGFEPRVYHATNVLWHLANVALVFWLIYLLCGRMEVAGLTALLFGIHPMHLESVAWVSSRKDVLYGFFFLLGLVAYLHHLKSKPGRKPFYWMCMLLFLLSLLCKGMAVTFPLVLLAIDYLKERLGWRRLILEKVHFLVLSLAFGILAVVAQQQGAALEEVREVAYSDSFFVASYGTLVYLIKALIPFQLSAFHPYPALVGQPLPWYFYGAALPVLLLVFLCVRFQHRCRLGVFGLAFFVMAIAPVLQFLPVGQAVIAERYTYLAYIGLFFPLAVAVVHLIGIGIDAAAQHRHAVFAALLIYVGLLGAMTFQRSGKWENGETLWTDVIEKYPSDFFAYGTRASYYMEKGDHEKALADYDECLRLNPGFYEAFNNRGLIYTGMRKYDLALADFDKSLKLKDDYSYSYTNRGLVYLNTKRYENALADLNQAIALNPDFTNNYYNLGLVHQRLENLPLALENYNKAIGLDPQQPMFYKDRGFLFGFLNQYDKALADFSQAIELDPSYAEAYYWRSIGFFDLKRYDLALQDALQARHLGYRVEDDYIKSLQ
jgi:tetratricopeptide (TPR) repeat protein